MTNVRIYVGTYNKYNEGSLYGKWLDLSNFSNFEEFQEEIRKLHEDEEDPEYMFQDYECPKLYIEMGLISECHISNEIFEIIETLENSSYGLEVVEAYCDCVGCYNESIEDIISKVEDSYNGEFESDIEFVQDLLESCGDIPKDLPSYIYIDWNSTSYDIMMDYSTSSNHYFRNL